MKLKEGIIYAATALNLDGVLTQPELSDTDKLLIRCANNCLDEITSEYLPLKCELKVTATGGSIPYSMLGDTIYDVLSVTDGDGVKIKFELMPSRIKVEKDGEYTVKFCTRPPILAADDEVPVQLRLTPRIMSYGIAAEYLLISGFYEEAITYDTRFKDALKRAVFGGSEKRVKQRRWLL